MILLFVSIFLFNFIAIKSVKRLTGNQKLHIWCFTISFQVIFDLIIEFKFNGYWYFDKGVDWLGLLSHTVLIPPVNLLFLNWYPFKSPFLKQVLYLVYWTIGINLYELTTLLPEPFGFFNLGWWKVWYDLFIVPTLFLLLLLFYKWINILEKELFDNK